MANLIDIGLSEGIIVETIVSTYDKNGRPTAAPMGVKAKDAQHIIIRPYTSTQTYKNLGLKQCAVVNLTSDPELFYHTAFKETNPEGKVPWEWFGDAERVNAPKLNRADAFIEISVLDVRDSDADRADVLCDVKLIKVLDHSPRGYCRATFATIEAIIHATRVGVFLDIGEQEKAQRLIDLISHYTAIVNRVAPNSHLSEIMAGLNRRTNPVEY